jgi:periplasmic protein TonB
MTSAYAHRSWSQIGAIELKSSYRRNMYRAMLIVLLMFTVVLAFVALWRALTPPAITSPRSVVTITPDDLIILDPPPQIRPTPPIRIVEPEKVKPVFNTNLIGIDDELVKVDFTLFSKDDLARMTPSSGDVDGMGYDTIRISGSASDEGYLTAEPGFVAYDDNPVLISQIVPKYPELARKAQLEGKVCVEILIDTRGDVKKARIAKSSGSNVGFEEAALEAALQSKWRPAMQNKQPVAVWVSFPIVFKLK